MIGPLATQYPALGRNEKSLPHDEPQRSLPHHRRAHHRRRGLWLSALPGAGEDHGYRHQHRQKRYFHREEIVRDFPDGALMARQSENADQGLLSLRSEEHT